MTTPAPRTLRCEDLGPGPSAETLMRRAVGRPGLVCLRGQFADGVAVLTSHPVHTATSLPDEPSTDGRSVDGVDLIGGGWFGVAGFDAGRSRFAFHDHVVRRVHGRWRFEALWTDARADELTRRRDEWAALLLAPDPDDGAAATSWTVPGRDAHLAAVERAIELIRAGELYQVNVCTRFEAVLHGHPAHLFAEAARRLDPAYGAYLDATVVALSPELFLRRRGRRLTSSPIKGTLPTGPGQARRLRDSAKDVAENVMIVDLVRNDLGQVCETGTVRPVRLLEVDERVGVLHLVSEVDGIVREGVTDAAAVRALFPPASVTGTPKLRALAAIEEIEHIARGAHTGAVGFVSPCWGAEFAVAIRTLEIDGAHVALGVGGGVTVDSVPDAEWQECLHKAAPIAQAAGGTLTQPRPDHPADTGVFETILALDGRPVRLRDHLARLDRSVRELTGRGLPDDTAQRVSEAARRSSGRAAVRVAVEHGRVDVTARAAAAPSGPSHVTVGTRAPGLWRHKWLDRSWAVEPDGGTSLYLDDDGAVLETTRGNVFLLSPDGTLVTPPLRPGLLPGVTRRALLDHALDTGRPSRLRAFGLLELTDSVAFWTSSLSGAVPIATVDGVELPRDDATVAAFASALLSP